MVHSKKFSPKRKYICLLGITDAVRYMHSVGIIRMNLKPESILIDENYYPKVCDFGLARCFSNKIKLLMSEQDRNSLYIAPELFENENHYGTAVDVYSFAFLVYEIITGKDPFSQNGNSSPSTFPEIMDGVQKNMKELIEKCWSKDPKDCPSFDEIFETLSSDFSHSFSKRNKSFSK